MSLNKNLKISNMVISGRMPFKHKLKYKEICNIIRKSDLNWSIINEEISPIIRRFAEKSNYITVRKKKGNQHVSIWTSGAIVITGITTKSEANFLYKQTLEDLIKLCPRVFKK